eukprot:5715637-Prymnesium_polylepis.3
MRPLAGHPHAVWLATHPPCDSTQHARAAPFLPFLPVRTLCLPARRRLSRCDPRGLTGARGTCGQRCLSPPRRPRRCTWVRSRPGVCACSSRRPPWRQ